jgi:hypothetical protein
MKGIGLNNVSLDKDQFKKREGDVVSLLFYFEKREERCFVVVLFCGNIFNLPGTDGQQCFAHIFQRRICLNPSQGPADR